MKTQTEKVLSPKTQDLCRPWPDYLVLMEQNTYGAGVPYCRAFEDKGV